MDLKSQIAAFPTTSGVYLMKSREGQVIYVGKAVCLRKRVQSYFRKFKIFSKADLLVAEIAGIDHLDTASEAEALILEASLIKQYHPKYNIELRDDKSYPYIEITKEQFPKVSVVRLAKGRPASFRRGAPGARHFGPYVDAALIREALIIIRKIFHFRTCHPLPKKVCLDFHMGLCDAPCEKKIDEKEYAKIIRHVVLILEGKKDELYQNLREDMEMFSREKQFEEAARVREQIRAIGALYSGTKDINCFKEAEQLQRALDLPKLPERIEAFDISNIMGQQAAGSMVSFLSGRPDKHHYRRFRIRDVHQIDDFQMIAEIVRRRYTRLKNDRLVFPDLILIDGGKGQLSAATEELRKLDIHIPIISLAKREEEIFLPNRRRAVVLPQDSLGLKLLERIRDEAHRFAIAYHRHLRGKNVFTKKAP